MQCNVMIICKEINAHFIKKGKEKKNYKNNLKEKKRCLC